MQSNHILGSDFERLYIDIVCARIQELGMNHSEFARKVFGPEGPRVWRFVRKPLAEGKPRRVTMSEGVEMAKVLGMDYPSLAWQVWQQLTQEQK